jgi:hypothetical protein
VTRSAASCRRGRYGGRGGCCGRQPHPPPRRETANGRRSPTPLPPSLVGRGRTAHGGRSPTPLPPSLVGRGETADGERRPHPPPPLHLVERGRTAHGERPPTPLPPSLVGRGRTADGGRPPTPSVACGDHVPSLVGRGERRTANGLRRTRRPPHAAMRRLISTLLPGTLRSRRLLCGGLSTAAESASTMPSAALWDATGRPPL